MKLTKREIEIMNEAYWYGRLHHNTKRPAESYQELTEKCEQVTIKR